MRAGCYECTFKHLGQAAVWTYRTVKGASPYIRAMTALSQAGILQAEMKLGYPEHAGLFMGHLACASEELVAFDPELAKEIRRMRIAWFAHLVQNKDYHVGIDYLLTQLADTKLTYEGEDAWQHNNFEAIRQARVLGHLAEASEECMEAAPDLAPTILGYLEDWRLGVATNTEPSLAYENLFESLMSRFQEGT